MQTFRCSCGSTIFFESSLCVRCGAELGWCPACRSMTALVPDGERLRCGRSGCGAPLVKCSNYALERVCNRCCPADAPGLCDYCRFNATIPDLSVEGNRERWARLEAAKRRLLYTLDLLGLPYGDATDGVEPPLSFAFEADPEPTRSWWKMGEVERVYTGHANGRITIDVAEADDVAREKARTWFGEAHRTIIGHFRHEIGHYYWQMLVQGRCEPRFVERFGNHESPSYADAQQRYYDQGPPAGWEATCISAYAAMHPWEDFAECFGTYLDMVSVLDIARQMKVGGVDPTCAELQAMIDAYAELGVVLNEMNRAQGLVDLVPEVLGPPVVAKLGFVHELVRAAARTSR